MGLKRALQGFLRKLLGIPENMVFEPKEFVKEQKTNLTEPEAAPETREFHSIWNFLDVKENTQAAHIIAVIGFDEWVEMEEIRRRILEVFGIQYKNERSLYPHLKTLTDLGLLETTDAGGRRKWRKKEVLIKIQKNEQKRKERTTVANEKTAQTN